MGYSREAGKGIVVFSREAGKEIVVYSREASKELWVTAEKRVNNYGLQQRSE